MAMRPNSIRWFDRLFLAYLLLFSVEYILLYPLLRARDESNQFSANFGAGFTIANMAFGFGVQILLWYLIGRRASNIARWIWVALAAVEVLLISVSIRRALGGHLGLERFALALTIGILRVPMIFCLFRPDASAWFAAKGRPVNPAIFD
jgi:hypothetical protein